MRIDRMFVIGDSSSVSFPTRFMKNNTQYKSLKEVALPDMIGGDTLVIDELHAVFTPRLVEIGEQNINKYKIFGGDFSTNPEDIFAAYGAKIRRKLASIAYGVSSTRVINIGY